MAHIAAWWRIKEMFSGKLKEQYEGNAKAVSDSIFSLRSMLEFDAGIELDSNPSRYAMCAIFKYFKAKKTTNETDISNLRQAQQTLEKNGFLCVRIKLSGQWWKETSEPVLAINNDNKLVAFIPDWFGYKMVDPADGKSKYFKACDAANLQANALNISRNLPKKAISKKELIRYSFSIIPTKGLITTIVMCLITALLCLCVPIATKSIFSEVIPSGLPKSILPICGFLLATSISSILFQLCRNFALARCKDKINLVLQSALMNRLLYLPSSFFKKYSSGNLGMRILSANNIYQLITNQLLTGMASAVFSVMFIAIALMYSKPMLIVLGYMVVFAILEAYFLFSSMRKKASNAIPNAIRAQDFAYNSILGIQKIKNSRAEHRAFAQWASRYSKSEAFDKYGKFTTLVLCNTCSFLAYLIAWKSNIPISDYIAFMSAFGIMSFAIAEAMPFASTIASLSPYLDMLEPILSAEPEDIHDYPTVEEINGTIEINHISFQYSSNSPKILDDVSIHIPAGQNVALVGKSGCGKSTLMRLLLGFEEAQSGSIFYGQYNISKINLGSLRQFVGFCPQSMQIFPGTISENIRFASIDCTEEEIWRAASIACLDEDIMKMPDRLETRIGEGGSGLSGGQCQRLLIARAVINHPKVLFLDEATSALDNITQRNVVNNLSQIGCTRIAIAHRLSTVMNCDRIIVMDKGKIIEDGTPQQLLEMKGFFYELNKKQM